MAPQREDRYYGARQLAADVERFLADEPVGAYSDPWSVKWRRWANRNRTLVGGGVALLRGRPRRPGELLLLPGYELTLRDTFSL